MMTLGATTIGSDHDPLLMGQVEAFGPFEALIGGTVIDVAIYLDTSGSVTAGVYRDCDGRPGDLLAVSAAVESLAWSWVTVPLSLTLVQGDRYWLAFSPQVGQQVPVQAGASTRVQSRVFARAYEPGVLPDPFPTPAITRAETDGSVYLTYTTDPVEGDYGTTRQQLRSIYRG